jgi:hypothetical protein
MGLRAARGRQAVRAHRARMRARATAGQGDRVRPSPSSLAPSPPPALPLPEDAPPRATVPPSGSLDVALASLPPTLPASVPTPLGLEPEHDAQDARE